MKTLTGQRCWETREDVLTRRVVKAIETMVSAGRIREASWIRTRFIRKIAK